jgi:hypothetical protein
MGTIQILRWIIMSMELVACVTGFIYWHKVKRSYWRKFPFYLLFIVLAECVGYTLSVNKMQVANVAFFNYIEIPIEFLFFFWLFHQSFKHTKNNKLAPISTIIYVVAWLTDIFYFSKHKFGFYSFSYTVGNLLLLVLILRYYVQLVTSDEILTFKTNMQFWVSAGMLLYYLGTFPFYGLTNTLSANYKTLYYSYIYVMYSLNCLMYLMFTLGFIWSNPNSKYSSS